MPLGLLVRPSLHFSGGRAGEPLALAFSVLPPAELLETGRNFVKSEFWVLVMMTTSSS